jgi:hypothetical protein
MSLRVLPAEEAEKKPWYKDVSVASWVGIGVGAFVIGEPG